MGRFYFKVTRQAPVSLSTIVRSEESDLTKYHIRKKLPCEELLVEGYCISFMDFSLSSVLTSLLSFFIL